MSSWRSKQSKDIYIKKRDAQGMRSRASFKLEQVIARHRMIKNGDVVVELGSAPGGWSQVLAKVNDRGINVACDLLEMQAVPGVFFVKGDFLDVAIQDQIKTHFSGKSVDVLLSDMAPNLTGNRVIDQRRCEEIWMMALDFASDYLKKNGFFLIKVFHGNEFKTFLDEMKRRFSAVHVVKPDASRKSSSEVYLLGEKFRL